jgi:Icc-related predicted phosphoesterase
MNVLITSDSHLEYPYLETLPEADIFIHAGDWTNLGYRHSKAEFALFEKFLSEAREKYPVVLALHGNHDLGFSNYLWTKWGVTPIDGITYQHSSGLTIHGVALTPAYDKPEMLLEWQFMTIDEAEEEAAWDFEAVDIVVSHGPPFGYLDLTHSGKRIGSREAVSYIRQKQPKLFICGHIHEAAGEAVLRETRIINTAGRWQLLEL